MPFDKTAAFNALSQIADMEVKQDAPLHKLNTYHVGGSAAILLKPKTSAALGAALKAINANGWPYYVLGKGSNVLISDEGLPAIVINTGKLLGITIDKDALTVEAYAGEGLQKLIDTVCGNGLGGLEKLGGIPGSVGGALMMNAGAFDVETGNLTIWIEGFNADGSEFSMDKDAAGFGYRQAVGLQGKIITRAKFKLSEIGNDAFLLAQAQAVALQRAQKQPLHLPSCGSVFKRNYCNDGSCHFAGELIEKCSLKGKTIGDAQISDKHANFILNLKHATAADIYQLLRLAQTEVQQKFGIQLEPEVKLLGRFE